ncbi:Protein CBG18408 [Caenorhabditis briggsae]|uniref:Protein CBG18408 n=1 Tax=Caenorhabditis briggsae TaxID=6238 RepID=A8XT93_CAEBR|nr:Protein CBG18408 [Caenorhabditis briggsae]CAP35870.2 Protein CBG18408 [Caenorhabditis briggsae]
MKTLIFFLIEIILSVKSSDIDAKNIFKGLYETSGFHCYSRDSMRLPRHLHGRPQTTDPPFDLSVFDSSGKRVESYEVGKVYTGHLSFFSVKLEAYVHFRGLLLQPRLCTPNGAIIGTLRGGKFIEDEQFETHGLMFHQCGRLVTNDSLTHTSDDKKFLTEAKWHAQHDVGNVQFVATIATENVLYWEKWRPKHAFLKGPYQKWSHQNPNIFVYNLEKEMEQKNTEKVVTSEPITPSQHPLFEEQKEFLKGKMGTTVGTTVVPASLTETSENSDDVFDFDGLAFEITGNPGPVKFDKIQVTAASMMLAEKTDVTKTPEISVDRILKQKIDNPNFQHSSKFLVEKPTESSFMMGRMFKKFAPLNDTVLLEDDLKFLNAHAHHRRLQHDFVDNNDLEMEGETVRVSSASLQTSNGCISTPRRARNLVLFAKCSEKSRKCVPMQNSIIKISEKCQDNPCENGGRCSVQKGKIRCQCGAGYTGQNCTEIDKCIENECENNSTCFNDKRSPVGYSCKCQNGTVGKLCEIQCPLDQCENGGKCYLNTFGKIGCKCLPGTTGRRCERGNRLQTTNYKLQFSFPEINECGWNKCRNGAKCVDLFNDYRCDCADGWMGRNCERPCQDIYGSCRVWKREGQCDQMKNATDFFDINCAASCGICNKIDNTTATPTKLRPLFSDTSYLPLQPILMPFAFLLGEWKSQIKGWNNHTTDYPIDMEGMVYNETITFSVTPSLSFGTPYLNYTATMTNQDDPSNIHQYNGFLTIQQYKENEESPDKGALTTVSNTGIIMIEEGEILDEKSSTEGAPTLMLTPTYEFFKFPVNNSGGNSNLKNPERSKRWFTLKNKRLMQYMVREFKGRTHKFTKIYKKTQEFKYL